MSTPSNPPAAASVRVRYSFLKMLSGPDLSLRKLPMMSAVSANPGPVVWLTACGHGDEICGMAIVQEAFRRMRSTLLCGEIHAFPLMNPTGFETVSRNIALSEEDLNRCFPGENDGSLGQRIAHRIFAAIMQTRPDLVLDLHTDWRRSIPYVLLDAHPGGKHETAYARAAAFARQSGLITITESKALSSSLSFNLLRRDVPALTLELGEPHVINEENVGYGLGVLGNLLGGLGMMASPTPPFSFPLPQGYSPEQPLTYLDRPYSSVSGVMRFLAAPGSAIKRGQPLAKVYNAFGKPLETVRATADAIVLGSADSSVVFPGMPIMAFGVAPPRNEHRVHRGI